MRRQACNNVFYWVWNIFYFFCCHWRLPNKKFTLLNRHRNWFVFVFLVFIRACSFHQKHHTWCGMMRNKKLPQRQWHEHRHRHFFKNRILRHGFSQLVIALDPPRLFLSTQYDGIALGKYSATPYAFEPAFTKFIEILHHPYLFFYLFIYMVSLKSQHGCYAFC